MSSGKSRDGRLSNTVQTFKTSRIPNTHPSTNYVLRDILNRQQGKSKTARLRHEHIQAPLQLTFAMPWSQRRGPPTPVSECSPASQFLGPKKYTEPPARLTAVIISMSSSLSNSTPILNLTTLFKHTPPHALAMLGLHKDNAHTLDSSDAQLVQIPGTTLKDYRDSLAKLEDEQEGGCTEYAHPSLSQRTSNRDSSQDTDVEWRMHWRTSRRHRFAMLVSSSSFQERYDGIIQPSTSTPPNLSTWGALRLDTRAADLCSPRQQQAGALDARTYPECPSRYLVPPCSISLVGVIATLE
ncbi:hypothetical protein ARMSODRAFT_1027074 [Armillaria solidipes]|uniref:Uncharacterized protein n=1 Tax=Armillaria solidipes TaxID=1076256 RepID=A0A2H3ALN1_9AGAR|nr:hypothetical protein ARMSODRAFT_1027074 [Armillaria solidipes]